MPKSNQDRYRIVKTERGVRFQDTQNGNRFVKQPPHLVEAMDIAERRITDEMESEQHRYKDDRHTFSKRLMAYCSEPSFRAMPAYEPDSRSLDRWLSKVWDKTPIWTGIVRSEAARTAACGYTLTGGRNAVTRARATMQRAVVAPDLCGYRYHIAGMFMDYMNHNIGGLIETVRRESDNALYGFYAIDGTNAMLTDRMDYPLEMTRGRFQLSLFNRMPRLTQKTGEDRKYWSNNNYWRLVDIQDTRADYRGLGRSATYNAISIIRMLVSLYAAQEGNLEGKPRGLLLLEGVSKEEFQLSDELWGKQWQEMSEDDRRWAFQRIMLLSVSGGKGGASANLTKFTDFEHFDEVALTETAIYILHLLVGRDPGENWPISRGSLNNGGKQDEIQHKGAEVKSASNQFLLRYQEKLMDSEYGLPSSVHLEYDDQASEGRAAELNAQLISSEIVGNVCDTLLKAGEGSEQDHQILMQMLVDNKLLSPEATTFNEDVSATDDKSIDRRRKRMIERVLEIDRIRDDVNLVIRSGIAKSEPEEYVTWHSNRHEGCSPVHLFSVDGTGIVDKYGQKMFGQLLWVRRAIEISNEQDVIMREDEDGDGILYDGGDVVITVEDVDEAIAEEYNRLGDFPADLIALGEDDVVGDDEDADV